MIDVKVSRLCKKEFLKTLITALPFASYIILVFAKILSIPYRGRFINLEIYDKKRGNHPYITVISIDIRLSFVIIWPWTPK
jgi:hypothetical protein